LIHGTYFVISNIVVIIKNILITITILLICHDRGNMEEIDDLAFAVFSQLCYLLQQMS